MSNFYTVPASPELLSHFIQNVRPLDREESEVVSGETWEEHSETLFDFIAEIEVLMHNDKVLGVMSFRALPPSDTLFVAWLMFTTEIENCKLSFLRWSKGEVQERLKLYPVMTNVVYMKNKLHVDWLTWVGAVWLPVEEEGDIGIFQLSIKEEQEVDTDV